MIKSAAVAGQLHDNHREEESITLPENRNGIIPLSFHPLTHCGTISVSKMCHRAPRHLSHSVPVTRCSAQASLQQQQGPSGRTKEKLYTIQKDNN